MAAQAHVQPILWFDLEEQTRFFSRLKRTLFLSLVLHLIILVIAAGIRLPQRGERPLAAIEVSLVSAPTPPVKRVEIAKPVEPVKLPEPKPAPVAPVREAAIPTAKPAPAPAPIPTPSPAAAPVRQSMAKDILRDLPQHDLPKFGDLTPAKVVAQPQPQAARTKIPDLPRIPDVMPDQVVKAPQHSSLSDDVNRELEEELKKMKQFQPAQKLDIPKEAPVKPAAQQQEASLPVVKVPQTMLKTSGSSGTNPFWGRVEAIIKSHWEPPPIDVSGQTYSVVIRFRFYRNGTVKDVGIQQTSGNSYFDMAGQRAVLKPRMLPAFPAEMTEPYQDVEMLFRVGEAVG
ncbi:MAG TPA: TonB family protein [Nitrospira sp.]